MAVERYSAEGRADIFAYLAREVVRSNPDLVIAPSSRMVLQFIAATTTIPIVAAVADPVAAGMGGNVTGVGYVTGRAPSRRARKAGLSAHRGCDCFSNSIRPSSWNGSCELRC